jgi:predicted transposase/invertase (TIGR01784 family)
MQFVDVKNDIAFRKIFGNENRTESLISFLNAILEWEGNRRIASVTILNPFQLPKLSLGKVTIVDVRAVDEAGKTYLVEMQVAQVNGFSQRVLYYFSKSYSDQIQRGEFYRQLKPVIFIGVLDFMYTKNPHYISRNQVRDVETHERTIEDVEFTFLELPKFTKQQNELQTLTEKWVYFLKNAENLDIIPDGTDDNGLHSAYEQANQHTWTKDELDAYDYVFMREEDDRAKMDFAINRAKQEGEQIGQQLGEQLGEQRGEQRGKEQQQIASAKRMIAAGSDNAFIAMTTDLPNEQIEQLRSER